MLCSIGFAAAQVAVPVPARLRATFRLQAMQRLRRGGSNHHAGVKTRSAAALCAVATPAHAGVVARQATAARHVVPYAGATTCVECRYRRRQPLYATSTPASPAVYAYSGLGEMPPMREVERVALMERCYILPGRRSLLLSRRTRARRAAKRHAYDMSRRAAQFSRDICLSTRGPATRLAPRSTERRGCSKICRGANGPAKSVFAPATPRSSRNGASNAGSRRNSAPEDARKMLLQPRCKRRKVRTWCVRGVAVR